MAHQVETQQTTVDVSYQTYSWLMMLTVGVKEEVLVKRLLTLAPTSAEVKFAVDTYNKYVNCSVTKNSPNFTEQLVLGKNYNMFVDQLGAMDPSAFLYMLLTIYAERSHE